MATPTKTQKNSDTFTGMNLLRPHIMLPQRQFGKMRTECVLDWIRLFKPILKILKGESEDILVSYACSLLVGDAGKYIDEIDFEPTCWKEFADMMIKKYSRIKKERTTMMKHVLLKTQAKDETLTEFSGSMKALCDEARVDEELGVMTIGATMHQIQPFIKLHIKNNYTYERLFRIIEAIEDDIEGTDDADSEDFLTFKATNRTEHKKLPHRECVNDNDDISAKLDRLTLLVETSRTPAGR
ncbi:hypothetical protein EDEG_04203 [Edhazardia aedis USNM 41457]|uniref:Uncharacterized protein n=1 Tax=Edhazardia aedis (strain USNM 41457) TaxID=1003232 RepID=J9DAZ8_EDHAE|nr:hypothetical protein EDEG_04203 [Edhazardia aedis USNM 41457]|eukprot:EJW04669.1 hypothetical protein EDEG_04203 [Edhazardia aedis USNM 41457]